MSLAPGSHVGPYEVIAQLGEGAMGVVFRARDTKLLREVALKALPDHFADDPDRLSRLEREAQLLASVNHPNIAQIYGLEQRGSGGCLVMELVEGATLAERLRQGPLPLDEALGFARQIAEGLAAAHERGIVHRDLKPANIKLTPNGTVKILDFGLAKPLAVPGETGRSSLPTMVGGSTAGAIVGTVAYMSPEQARGRDVDARTDIWAFGCVLYEMLTGRLAFGGETVTDMMASIVTAQPDLQVLPPSVPDSIRLLLAATLNKNVQQRLQHVGDVRLFLDPTILPDRGAPASTQAVARRAPRWRSWAALSFAAGLAAALVPAWLYVRSRPVPEAPRMHLDVALPGYAAGASVSPDGQRIVYMAEPPGEIRALWMRAIGAEGAQKLAGTERSTTGGSWSPDSRSLVFVAEGKLKKLDVTSGSVQTVCDVPEQIRGFSWSRDGVMLLTRGSVIVRVPESGGEVTPVTELDAARKETIHAAPVFLPDGRHFLYAIGSPVQDTAGIYVGSLEGKTKTRIMPLGPRLTGLAYASPGYVIMSGESLTAQRFDIATSTVQGSPVPLADAVEGFSVSDTGLLVYRRLASRTANKQLTWFDREGKQIGQVGTAADYGNIELSPNGDRLAVDITTGRNRDIWMIDLARSVSARLTFDPAADWTPVWSPDGSAIVFASNRSGTQDMYRKASSGVGNEELVIRRDGSEIPVSWSRNGRYIVFSSLKSGPQPGSDTWLLEMAADRKASPFIESPFDKAQARISPDGRWIAYVTDDSGAYQIVVQSFPDPNGGKWQITAQGGIEPKWRRDGRELYYLGFDGRLMSLPVKSDPTFEAGTPTPLFQTPLAVSRTQPPRDRRYDVAADGRFLVAAPEGASSSSVTAIVNWVAGLPKN